MEQLLCFEQLQLRSSIVAERLMISECLDGGAWRQLGGLLVSGEHHRGTAGWPLAATENQTLREGVDSMKRRVCNELRPWEPKSMPTRRGSGRVHDAGIHDLGLPFVLAVPST
ncbi:BTB/POZ domain-containing protein [Panicum miliaceum]|uniref:BTB/POZ domain-containing protein n=1 Tax=Panicum miliaceum TaxID=4540 RepID=A0A3L6T8C9_PANMI|nr:BTB/POZ domain-containing protein [Panicum miliaceum]